MSWTNWICGRTAGFLPSGPVANHRFVPRLKRLAHILRAEAQPFGRNPICPTHFQFVQLPCNTGTDNFPNLVQNSTFPKMGILEPKHGSISPTASRPLPASQPLRPLRRPAPLRPPSAYDLPNARPVPSRPLSHPYGPHRPLSRACRPRLRAEARSTPSDGLRRLRALRCRDDRSRSQRVTGTLADIPASPRPRKANRSSSTRSQSPTSVFTTAPP